MNKALSDRPPTMTTEELEMKLRHLRETLGDNGFHGIVFEGEGAMRWLTGRKHQLADIAPAAASPVNASVEVKKNGRFSIVLASKPFETPRLRDEMPPVFEGVPGVDCEIRNSLPEVVSGTLLPDDTKYKNILDAILRPVLGGADANPYRKLVWLSRASMLALGETAHRLRPGMSGMQVAALQRQQLADYGIDANLALIALTGQGRHLHPVAAADYRVEPESWLKLVTGSRYAEHIVSQTLMVKLGGKEMPELENTVYHALQDAALEYADCYREGRSERDIHRDMIECFRAVGARYGLDGFADSAILHHPGGGTSPLGNRDRLLNPECKRQVEAWTQFAINPVDALQGLKVELQGIVQPAGQPPLVLDTARYADDLILFRKLQSESGNKTMLPELTKISRANFKITRKSKEIA